MRSGREDRDDGRDPDPDRDADQSPPGEGDRLFRSGDLSSRGRYQLLTSLVVPRPIGWLSTRDPEGAPNLAPFSFYTALSSSPMLVGISIGLRSSGPKDTLRNVRRTGAFCVNVVGESQLEVMNETAADFEPEIDEARRVGLDLAQGRLVDAPYVTEAPAVLECTLYREIELAEAGADFVIGRVEAVHLAPDLRLVPGTRYVDPETFRPVGRLHGRAYGMLGEVRFLHRGGSGDGS